GPPDAPRHAVPGVERDHGEDIADQQAAADAEVQGAGVHALPDVRPAAGLPPQIPALSDLLPQPGAAGGDPRRGQGVLIGATGEPGEGARRMAIATDPVAERLTRIR